MSEKPECKEDGCAKPTVGRGMCRKHYVYWYRRREGDPCIVPGCKWAKYQGDYCATHHHNFQRHGDPLFNERRKSRTHRPAANGYVYVRRDQHPRALSGFVLEHRVVMEDMLGRYLTADENVHHVNGNRSDNRPENLELWISKQPSGQRIQDLVSYAEEIIAQYASEAKRLDQVPYSSR